MNTTQLRGVAGPAVAVLALAVLAAPAAAAGKPVVSTWSDAYVVEHDCGVIEETTMSARETAYFDGGTWVRSSIHFVFDGVYTGPTGKTYANQTRQNGTFTPDVGQLRGQGTFLRGAGGVLVMDTGRLVFYLESGETIHASAQAIRWDDPAYPATLEAALCTQLG